MPEVLPENHARRERGWLVARCAASLVNEHSPETLPDAVMARYLIRPPLARPVSGLLGAALARADLRGQGAALWPLHRLGVGEDNTYSAGFEGFFASAPVDSITFGHPASRSGVSRMPEYAVAALRMLLPTPGCRGAAHVGACGTRQPQKVGLVVGRGNTRLADPFALFNPARVRISPDARCSLLKSVCSDRDLYEPHMAAKLGAIALG